MIAVLAFGLLFSSYFAYWLYGNKPTITISKEASNKNHRTSRILELCPDFQTRFIPSFWLLSGHLQTVGAAMIRKTPHVEFEREKLYMADGGFVTLDWVSLFDEENKQEVKKDGNTFVRSLSFEHQSEVKSKVKSETRTGTVIVMHGLTGGSNESYVRHAVNQAKKHKLNCVAFNYRGAAGTELATPIAYSGAQTDDIRAVVKHIRKVLPFSPIFAVGFSLGANILSKYVGEEGPNCLLSGAVSISNPFKFVEASHHLVSTWFLKNVYSKALGSNLKRFLKRHADMMGRNKSIDVTQIENTVTFMRDFDEQFTRRVYGFNSVDDYYTEASSATRLKNIAIPYLALNAMDDPISPGHCVPFQEFENNSNLILITTKRGGHTGWLQGWNLFALNNSWMDKVAFEFISAVIKTEEKNE